MAGKLHKLCVLTVGLVEDSFDRNLIRLQVKIPKEFVRIYLQCNIIELTVV